MTVTIELSSSAIRLCREQGGRITGLESWPIAPGTDPLAALAAAPLPNPLGRVCVVTHHDDMLLRTLLQPPCPPDRLDRLVRFELQGASGDGGDPVGMSWELVKGLGGDLRILALVTKIRYVQQLQQALAPHGAKLASLIPPGVALHAAFRTQEPRELGPAVLLDIGGKRIHLALVNEGELVFLRSQGPGMEDLVKGVAELRGIGEADALKLVSKLGRGAPADLHELVRRQAQAVATLVNNTLRFAKAQLHLDDFAPKAVYLAGHGAAVHGLADGLKERLGLPIRHINPFAGPELGMRADDLDRLAVLPSQWTLVMGPVTAKHLALDALAEERAKRAAFWRGEGALRIAAVLAVGLLVLAVVRQELSLATTRAATARLLGTYDPSKPIEQQSEAGLVPRAEAARKDIDRNLAIKASAGERIAWLDGERRPGRIALELLAAVSAQQDPATCPVVLQSYKVERKPGVVEVALEGYATGAGATSTDKVLKNFVQGLRDRYPVIAQVEQLPKPLEADKQPFHYRFAIPDGAVAR